MNVIVKYILQSLSLLQDQTSGSLLLASDKIYSVLTVILLVFAAVIFYLVQLGRKVGSLEQSMEELEGK
ncbi:MAG: CcmD family protein [Bacteroidota bacterium]